MSLNTVKTTLGYCYSLVEKYTPVTPKSESLNDIYNYLPINERISTSGQPSEKQFSLIKDEGFELVVNLAPHHAENSLKNEGETLSALGLDYIHIPVNFVKPTEKKFEQFTLALANNFDKKIWIHCAANMRVSAFLYRYHCQVLKIDETSAAQFLQKIWQPIGVWKKFTSNYE